MTESVFGLVGSETSKSMLKESCQGTLITKSTSSIVHSTYDSLLCLFLYLQIEAASKYSTVDTLKQQYRFVAAKYKVGR